MLYQRIYSAAVAALLLAACSQPVTQAPPASNLTPVFAVSELLVGPNRMALGLLQDGSPVNDPGAQITLKFYDRADTSATIKNQTSATYYGQGLPAALYVAYPTFDRAGEWDVVVETQLSGATQPSSTRLRFQVQEASNAPNVGQRAPAVTTPTALTTPLEQLSSGSDPDPALYQLSLDQALNSGKPTAVLFATPGYCRTAMCGPNIKVLSELQQAFGERVNFVHVEVYRYPFEAALAEQAAAFSAASKNNRPMTDAEKVAGFSDGMATWRLSTEPWLFLIDQGGVIEQRYEGGITREELTPALEQLAS
ncbi:MAG: thioredoxin family protein [Roseiflexaceae bacterium]|nr:thioredoxin family protein [Roseiflexaceae bacterium]